MAGPIVATMANLDTVMATAKATANANAAADAQQAPIAARSSASEQRVSDETPELKRVSEQLRSAESRKREVEARLQERAGHEIQVQAKYRELLGTPEEKTRLENVLADRNSTALAQRHARDRIAQMKQAAAELPVLHAAVQQSVFSDFTRGMEGLRKLEGMDESNHQALYKAPTGIEALKLIHAVGRKAGEAHFKREVASLRGQIRDLQGQLGGAAGAPPGGQTASLYGPDGLPTEESITAAKRGQLRQISR